MASTYLEHELRRTARLTLYALSRLKELRGIRECPERTAPDWLIQAAEGRGGERAIPVLCALIKDMDDRERELILYDCSPMARDLASWWEVVEAEGWYEEYKTPGRLKSSLQRLIGKRS